MNTLIKDAAIFLPDGNTMAGSIAIEGDTIAAVGDAPEGFAPEKIIDGKDKFVIPGLINAHTHASMSLLRSYADDMDLMDWLQEKIWPAEDKMDEDDIYWGAALAIVEMIKTGTTAFADLYGPYMEKVAQIATESGIRASLGRGLIGVAPDSDIKLQQGEELFRNFHNTADGRITVMIAPHAIYTCPPEFLKKAAATAHRIGADIHIHMAETKTEVENCLKEYGKRPFAHAESTGLFERGAMAAHCVWLDDEDFDIIKKHNIRVVHNPGSNMKLASGVAPVPRMLKENIVVALGTDGASSNNNLDMFEEIRLAALLHKVHSLDPLAVDAVTAIKMATEEGAKAINTPYVGKIEAGMKADLVLLDITGEKWQPRFNLPSLLAYSADSSSVDTVMVNGNILMEKRELLTLDEEKIYFNARRSAKKLTGQ